MGRTLSKKLLNRGKLGFVYFKNEQFFPSIKLRFLSIPYFNKYKTTILTTNGKTTTIHCQGLIKQLMLFPFAFFNV